MRVPSTRAGDKAAVHLGGLGRAPHPQLAGELQRSIRYVHPLGTLVMSIEQEWMMEKAAPIRALLREWARAS